MGHHQSGDGFGVGDLPVEDHAANLGQGQGVNGDNLVGIQVLGGGERRERGPMSPKARLRVRARKKARKAREEAAA